MDVIDVKHGRLPNLQQAAIPASTVVPLPDGIAQRLVDRRQAHRAVPWTAVANIWAN